jgi:hypothetical protein|tara:strand:- start:1100 stop:1420 length:321 start_codon:yes stop_codon:yes gene_type:complete
MALTTHAEIRSEIIDHLEQLREMRDPEDLLHELAESNTPIMYHDIISEWQQMPSEFDNGWQMYGFDESFENGGIYSLMAVDLQLYYESQFLEIWEEVKDAESIPEA